MGKFSPKVLKPSEIRAYRKEHDCGLMEAKRELQMQSIRHAFSNVFINGTLEDKVDFLLEQFGATLK